MVASYYGKMFRLQFLRDSCFLSRDGVSILNISEAAKKIGFNTFTAKATVEELIEQRATLPSIVHWNQNHFVVLTKISKKIISNQYYFHIADPGHGLIKLSEDKFKNSWISDDTKGVTLFLEPTDKFNNQESYSDEDVSIKYLLKYLHPYKVQMFWLFILLLLGTLTTLVFPILTRKLIDDGVNKRDLGVITQILLAQLAFFFGNIVFGIFRNWIMLSLGTKINIRIISDFFKKLFRLPIKFFDTKMSGDFNQRIQDHERIEQFLTSQSLITVFSILTFSVFFGVLWYYDFRILFVYAVFTALAISWSLFWIKKIKILDYFRFQQRSQNQQSIYEMINGVSEMKLNSFEDYKRTEWEKLQSKLYKINIRILKLDQIQYSGFEIFNQLKNIIVTFLAASFVIKDNMSLGTLLSISYIIGQMNSPVNQLVNFFRSLQDAKLSLARLNEVQNHPEEEQEVLRPLLIEQHLSRYNSAFQGISLKRVSFQYEGPKSRFVLKNVNLDIPEGKVTAIVGSSGSGKTTLMKLLLKYYDTTSGNICYGEDNILALSPKSIRERCGVVMQDGFIFSDTIERNIATGDECIDKKRLEHAVKVANIENFIEELPLKYNTKIGASGNGISGGQKQRILIARAVYKNPHFILFDEATSALDAENEKIIHNNLQSFFTGKTVVIIAHRLSTVKKADQIIVLKNGETVEQGCHHQLVEKKGEYYNLVKNQLELGD